MALNRLHEKGDSDISSGVYIMGDKMRSLCRLLVSLAMLPYLAVAIQAATNYVGQVNQQVNFGGSAQPVSGSVSVIGSTITVTVPVGSALPVDGSGVTQPISAANLPLPTGAATGAKQDTGNTSLSSIDGKVLTDSQLRASAVPVSAASLPLPAGAATAAKQPALGTAGTPSSDVLTIQGAASMEPIRISPVTVTAPAYSSATVTTSSVMIIAANTARKGVECSNLENIRSMYLKIGSAATGDSLSELVPANTVWSPPVGIIPTGSINLVTASLTADVSCREY